MAANGVDKKQAVIRSVTDQRIFEQEPSDPSVPSLGFGGSDSAPDAIKERAVARKRNGFGKAMGDVLLEHDTVKSAVRQAVQQALTDAGYQVVNEGQSSSSEPDLTVDVRIVRFWSWFNPGFWAITLHTAISTDFMLKGRKAPLNVSVQSDENYQAATDGNWKEIINKALDEYQEQTRKLFSSPLHLDEDTSRGDKTAN